MLWKRSLHLTFLLCFTFSFGQTQLKTGDISIIGLNCETEDFMFVTFVPLSEGTEIYFTDEEADGSYQIGLGEGTVLYTVPAGGLDRGTVISFQSNAIDFSVTSDGNIALANSGDGLIAYQGDAVSEVTVFLDALGSDVASIGTFPGGFGGRVLGAVNGQYQGVRNGLNQSSYLVRISDLNDWQLVDSGLSTFDLSSFSFDTTPILFSSKYEILSLGYDFDEESLVVEVIIQGDNLSSVVQVVAPVNFEISLNENGPFQSMVSLNPILGDLSSSSVYVRMKEDLDFGTYSEFLTISSNGDSTIEVKFSGSSRMGYANYCNDLFISEYIEGTSNNKFIEFFNPTASEILLNDSYKLEIYSNGSIMVSNSIALEGVVGSNGVFILKHPSESLNVSADQQSGILNFNGNDALVLKKGNKIIDVVGQVGFDPGVEWTDLLCGLGTQDGGLIRKSNIELGSTSASDTFKIDEEWTCTSIDDISNLGIHTIDNPAILTKWDGNLWDAGIPDFNDVALINGDYNTLNNGNLEACMLYISKDVNFEIKPLNPTVLHGDALVKGNLNVNSFGSFVQTNDDSEFTLVHNGTSQLIKQTSILNNWYEYTYWSSPVSDIPIETALDDSPPNRRFYFVAANFIDVLAEVGNSGVYNPGSDGIDDNGDDWQLASGTMIPGIGYAATMSPTGFTPGVQSVVFEGEFNNGSIEVPVIANSGGAYDDWNFIGNPYPGGLDVSAFFNENSGLLSEALYLWSHNTEPQSSVSGNYAENFSNSDYAIITGSGINVAGGDGVIPESFVPSGQGFLVEAKNSGNVVFNNSMRSESPLSNTQFFKNSMELKNDGENVVWLNLTGASGGFSQVAIGFMKGASDKDDGAFFDVKRKENKNAGAILYSAITKDENGYAIQTRGHSGIKNQIIPIEVKSNFASRTSLNLSIAKLKGKIVSNSPIIIYDKLTGISHDLTEQEFEFQVENGLISDRFELRFKIQKKHEYTTLKINSKIQLDYNRNGDLSFQNRSNKLINKVEIFDFHGRKIYEFKNVNPSQSYRISKVNTALFFAKIHFDENHFIIKKSLKKY